jgi:hypothetical protein
MTELAQQLAARAQHSQIIIDKDDVDRPIKRRVHITPLKPGSTEPVNPNPSLRLSGRG